MAADCESALGLCPDLASAVDGFRPVQPRPKELSREPYWTSASDFLALGVLNRRVYERLNVMIDSDAHIEDLIRRHDANPGGPTLPNGL